MVYGVWCVVCCLYAGLLLVTVVRSMYDKRECMCVRGVCVFVVFGVLFVCSVVARRSGMSIHDNR